MDFYELIETRESVRSYDPQKIVEEEILRKILEAGRLAPSAANRQPWSFVVVSSGEMLKKLRPCYPRPWFADAPHILAVVGNRNESWVRNGDGYNSLETDLAIAMDHLILAAANEGVGTCWIAAFNPAILKEVLSLKDNEAVFAITPLGYPKTGFARKPKQRKPFAEIVKII